MYTISRKSKNVIKFIYISLLIIVLTRAASGLNDILGIEFAENIFLICCIFICYVYTIVKVSIYKDISIIYINKNILLFIIMLLVISIYSDNFVKSLYTITIIGGLFIIANALIDNYSFKEIFAFLALAFIIICLFNIAFSYLYPNIGYDIGDSRTVHAWRGAFPTKNVGGLVMCLGGIISFIHFFYNKDNKIVGFLSLFLCFILLIRTQSATSLVTFFISIAAIVTFRKSKNKFNIVIVLLLVHVITYMFLFIGQTYSEYFHMLFGRDMTLTGRTLIWQAELQIIRQRPLFGYGYGVFWFNDTYQSVLNSCVNFKFIGAHNGFTGLLVEVGAIGTCGFIILLLDIGRKLKYIGGKNNLSILFSYAYLTYFLGYMISEQAFAASFKDCNLFFLMLVFSIINKEYYLKNKKNLQGDN